MVYDYSPIDSAVAIRVERLKKFYGAIEVLKGVDLTVRTGEVVAIIGRSGSGKSTFLRCLNGMESFAAGSLTIHGKVFPRPGSSELRTMRQRVGMIFQNFNLFPHLSVGMNVMLAPLVVLGHEKQAAEVLARQLLERVGLADRFDSSPGALSGGQQQRVAIARALALGPDIVLCDEITSALDPEMVAEVLKVMADLVRDGMTLVMVTHEMGFARRIASHIVFMHDGKVAETGPPDRIFDHPETPELQRFLALVDP